MNDLIYKQIQALLDDNNIGSLANIASYIYFNFNDLNWVGYYFIKDDILNLGPFMGKVACSKLSLNKGVCAKAFRDQEITIVNDVHKFIGHIACDSQSQSEIVLPIYQNKKIIGVLDIDAPIINRFNDNDIIIFTKIAEIISNYLCEYPLINA